MKRKCKVERVGGVRGELENEAKEEEERERGEKSGRGGRLRKRLEKKRAREA